MGDSFKVGKTIYVIVVCVFAFGVFLELVRSDYLLTLKTYNNQSNEESSNDESSFDLSTISNLEEDPFVVVFDPKDTWSKKLRDEVITKLKSMRKPYTVHEVSQLTGKLDMYSKIILTAESLDKIPDVQNLSSYVEEGGSLLFAIRPTPSDSLYRLYRKMGIFEIGPFITTKGIHMQSNLLFNQKGLNIDDPFITNSSLALRLDDQVKLHATSSDGNALLWERSYGKGRFVVFNGSTLHEKMNSGLLTGAISVMQDDFIYPIQNIKLMYLHSFPAPIPRKEESFYQDRWWPYIKEQSEEHQLSLTSGFLITFDEESLEFQDISERFQTDFVKYSRELLNTGGELAVTGANTAALTKETDVNKDSKLIQKFLEATLPRYTLRSYMPARRWNQESAVNEFVNSFSSIQNILPSFEDQTFEVKGGITYIPWTTSGYRYTTEVQWRIANSLNALGVFAHRITPWDDQLQDWETSKKELNKLLVDVSEEYPWLSSATANEAANRLRRMQDTEVYIEQKEEVINLYKSREGLFSFILRTDKSILGSQGCKVNSIDQGVYLIQADSKRCKVEVEKAG